MVYVCGFNLNLLVCVFLFDACVQKPARIHTHIQHQMDRERGSVLNWHLGEGVYRRDKEKEARYRYLVLLGASAPRQWGIIFVG
jgi:hypothetical protein